MQMPWRTPRMEANAEFIANARKDVPHLLDKVARLESELAVFKRGGKELGRMIEKQLGWVLDATGLHELIDEDGDGDWQAVWENLWELRPERDTLRTRLAAVEEALNAVDDGSDYEALGELIATIRAALNQEGKQP